MQLILCTECVVKEAETKKEMPDVIDPMVQALSLLYMQCLTQARTLAEGWWRSPRPKVRHYELSFRAEVEVNGS